MHLKELLKCFEYIKRYHTDMLDSIAIMLELFWLKRHHMDFLHDLISQAKKRKNIYDEFDIELQRAFGRELYTQLNPSANLPKILKAILHNQSTNRIIEEFLHTITQKKTTNKLYSYSTPLEINELLVGLLDIKPNESVYNPCYGIGSLFFAITNAARADIYGEELEGALAKIAKIICKILELDSSNLALNNILQNDIFKDKQFDKIICNPPLDSHIGTSFLKEDKRFFNYEALIKTYPELLFLIHSLSHLRQKGVFILRTQTLLKSSLEERLRERLCEDGLIEAIIELPKNIFPHQTQDFSIMVLSPNNSQILHLNANAPHFYHKDGKYNRLINLDALLSIYRQKAIGEYSSLTPLKHINPHDLSVAHYIQKPATSTHNNHISLSSLNVYIFRGQRVYGGAKDEKITYFDLGIADFTDVGFCEEFSTKRFKGEVPKILKYCLKPYDIAISLRGTMPKFTILSPKISAKKIVANAGIIIIRAPSEDIAIGIYCYLFSKKGQQMLSGIYERSFSALNPSDLEQMPIPKDYLANASSTFKQICAIAKELKDIESKLQALRG